MNFKRIIFALMLIYCMGFTIAENPEEHAIYISVIKIQHEEGANSADINMRVFNDDLKSILRNKFGYEAITEKETFCSDYGTYIQRYFEKRFICTINGEVVNFQLSNCERLPEVYQLAFKMDCPKDWKTAEIEADYFMELFPNQSNVLHLENGTIKRFGRTTKGNEVLKMRL